jgi:hypothetical protein
MNHHPYKACLVDGCSEQTYGKPYCHKHAKNKGKVTLITSDQRRFMRSDCCDATCVDGPKHEYGKQYCTKCKAPCLWHPHTLRVAS